MAVRKLYYAVKPLIPRHLQIWIRRAVVRRQREKFSSIWPVDRFAATPPNGWTGWPEGKRFALVLTHDVETAIGHDRCLQLMQLEKSLGFRSSFNFVPERYSVDSELRHTLTNNGFEVGVHGLNHDGRLYENYAEFLRRAERINGYIKNWGAVGFRSPAMHRNFDWIHELNIEYDASSFDTDPFEPMPDGVGTIFPFEIKSMFGSSYIELPYTLPQDFTLFILMQETNINIWKNKLEWIAQNGGMALLNVHPDYMHFGDGVMRKEEFPVKRYADFLDYINLRYGNQVWHVLPKQIAAFWRESVIKAPAANQQLQQQ